MKVLIISNSYFFSGAEKSLLDYLEKSNNTQNYFLCISNADTETIKTFSKYNTIRLPLIWFSFTYNPIILINYLFNIIFISIKIILIMSERKIDIIYSNTIKAQIYCLFIKLLTGKTVLWHVRDNTRSGFLKWILTKISDKIICNSNHILKQFSESSKCLVIYNGVDLFTFSSNGIINENIREKLNLPKYTILIAQVGQITEWKKQLDFIYCANKILQKETNIHFLIVGDDLSGNEENYLNQIKNEIMRLRLNNNITLIGHKIDIREVYTQIDILLHTAIDEPFGRVLIEAMAMEKPVVAYNCGGPKEIILNGETGFLIEPHNYTEMAQKTILLLNSRTMREKFGKNGRVRVSEYFNLNEYTRKIDQLLFCL